MSFPIIIHNLLIEYYIKQVASLFRLTEVGDDNQFPFVIPEYEEKLEFGKGWNSTYNYLLHKIKNY